MIRFSEIFYSVQGEGKRTGLPSIFIRFMGCNHQCAGFGQEDPMDKSTWNLDFQEYDPAANNVTSINDLPVWERGCDSVETWAPKFSFLAEKETKEDILKIMTDLAPLDKVDIVVTGGESLMPSNQKYIVQLLPLWEAAGAKEITFETNGTQTILPALQQAFMETSINISFSVSFKLQNVTGEVPEKAQLYSVVNSYAHYGDVWLKPVVTDTPACWEEVDNAVAQYKSQRMLNNVSVYVMPCGGTIQEQTKVDYMRNIADKALQRHWCFSIRAHVFIYGNDKGT